MIPFQENEVVGLVRPVVDAHTLGISCIAKLLRDCGYEVIIGERTIAEALNAISQIENICILRRWIDANRVTRLGFSHRLDPHQAQQLFGRFRWLLANHGLLAEAGGPIRGVYFAGLPEACRRIQAEYHGAVPVFSGDETPFAALSKLGVPAARIPHAIRVQSAYDDLRLTFGRQLIAEGRHWGTSTPERSGYPEYGTARDDIVKRLDHCKAHNRLPLMRAHVGPYLPQRTKALELFQDWVRQLRQAGELDVLSIGTSQLTQSHFGRPWDDRPNGGGVPIATEAEYRRIWDEARPMLVRTYAGTRNVPELARIHERSLNIAWHALSFWWFCLIDGRGPNTVLENLREHLATLDFIAASGKPFEPNIPHHFSFRGGDDVTYVLSAYLAARTAKLRGVKTLILQNMLNTPKYTLGIADLAKSRAMLRLVRTLEDSDFRVILQPRAGLDYFSSDLDEARAQLAAVTALMDDIEPDDPNSPPIIHVVSYSEASHLANPPIVNESIRIVRAALHAYRHQRQRGQGLDRGTSAEVAERTEALYRDAEAVLQVIHREFPDPYNAEDLYRVFAAGFLPVPYLWECRDEFAAATLWKTDIKGGGVKVVDEQGEPVLAAKRAEEAVTNVPNIQLPDKPLAHF